MTRAQRPDEEIDYAGSGAAGAERSVMVLRTGSLATLDPDPAASRAAGVHVLLVHLDEPELEDSPVFGGQTPAGSTAAALVGLTESENSSPVSALVAERDTVALAVALAAGGLLPVHRLVLVAPSQPQPGLPSDLAVEELGRVGADTLVIASAGERESVEAAGWYAEHLAHASRTILATSDVAAADGRLALADAWDAVLAFAAAPGGD